MYSIERFAPYSYIVRMQHESWGIGSWLR